MCSTAETVMVGSEKVFQLRSPVGKKVRQLRDMITMAQSYEDGSTNIDSSGEINAKVAGIQKQLQEQDTQISELVRAAFMMQKQLQERDRRIRELEAQLSANGVQAEGATADDADCTAQRARAEDETPWFEYWNSIAQNLDQQTQREDEMQTQREDETPWFEYWNSIAQSLERREDPCNSMNDVL
eukprot:gnl/TRDRNA2_/TRDRNA2_173925_c0_seq6.p1 gnl/TRDRNA2_/TRDRNA2_173925_c0~~gnl/TRDRNA2_/TRDRNA2_173925_c0_seq6.p1  ORF type:complete len:185 (+),score=51.18 gnl/TRDRNA2_/TRDRNA2_173925_c0_seq6:43-597(+)